MPEVNIFDHVEYRFYGKSGWKGRSYGHINYFYSIGISWSFTPVPKDRMRSLKDACTLFAGIFQTQLQNCSVILPWKYQFYGHSKNLQINPHVIKYEIRKAHICTFGTGTSAFFLFESHYVIFVSLCKHTSILGLASHQCGGIDSSQTVSKLTAQPFARCQIPSFTHARGTGRHY